MPKPTHRHLSVRLPPPEPTEPKAKRSRIENLVEQMMCVVHDMHAKKVDRQMGERALSWLSHRMLWETE